MKLLTIDLATAKVELIQLPKLLMRQEFDILILTGVLQTRQMQAAGLAIGQGFGYLPADNESQLDITNPICKLVQELSKQNVSLSWTWSVTRRIGRYEEGVSIITNQSIKHVWNRNITDKKTNKLHVIEMALFHLGISRLSNRRHSMQSQGERILDYLKLQVKPTILLVNDESVKYFKAKGWLVCRMMAQQHVPTMKSHYHFIMDMDTSILAVMAWQPTEDKEEIGTLMIMG